MREKGMREKSMIDNKVKETRSDKDIAQKQLAEMVGISRQALHAIENGLAVPSVEVALKMAVALNVKVERLFQLKEEVKPEVTDTTGALFS